MLEQLLFRAGGVAIAWLVSVIVWRLYFAPIAHIPGPKLAAATFLYEVWFDLDGRYWHKIRELHAVYGPIVRVNPREIHIADYEFISTIYSRTERRNKDVFHVDGLNAPSSVAATKSHEQHGQRRGALNPFFSTANLRRLEPFMNHKMDQLEKLWSDHVATDNVHNASDGFFALCQDVIKQYGFGHDDDLVADPDRAAVARENMAAILRNGKTMFWFGWVVRLTMKCLPSCTFGGLRRALGDFERWRSEIRAEVQLVLDGVVPRKQELARDLRTIFEELKDSPSLSLQDRSASRLEHEAILLVAAGSESSAKSMSLILFHLLDNPSILRRLRKEIVDNGFPTSWTNLEKLPFLSAVIEEGNRLALGLTGRTCRVAPDQSIFYGSYKLPAGTPISIMSIFVNMDESLFPDPWSFRPERWLQEGGKPLREYTMTFGQGSRRCIGMAMARMELFISISRVVYWDMELFDTTSRDVEFHHDFTVLFPPPDSKGIRVKVKGKAFA